LAAFAGTFGPVGERDVLIQEAQELMNIFGAIIRKSE
jgi:hypothetical protein